MYHLEEFDVVVLGDEPAGLWLLRRLNAIQIHSRKPRLAWLSLSEERRSYPIPVREAKPLLLSAAPPWSLSMSSPQDVFHWNASTLSKKYPGSAPLLQKSPLFSSTGHRGMESVDRLLLDHPDLAIYSMGLWRAIGRSAKISWTQMLRWALYWNNLVLWTPSEELPQDVVQTARPQTTGYPQIDLTPSGKFCIKLGEESAVISHKLVLALPLLRLMEIEKSKKFTSFLTLTRDILHTKSLYPFDISIDTESLPSFVRPSNLYLDNGEIPDLDTEVFPFDYRKSDQSQLRLWVSGRTEASLEGLTEDFRKSVGKFYRLLPFLPLITRSHSVPLSVETCSSPAVRNASLHELEHSRIELYRLSVMNPRTRHPRLFCLAPFVNCHFPYPFGTLMAAEGMLEDLLGTKVFKENKMLFTKELTIF